MRASWLVVLGLLASHLVRAAPGAKPTNTPLGDAGFLWSPGTLLSGPHDLEAFDDGSGSWSWVPGASRALRPLGAGYTIVPLEHPGESAALVALHRERGGLRVIGAWGDDFGGLGVELAILEECRAGTGEHLVVRLRETARGYWDAPGPGGCPAGTEAEAGNCRVPADETTSFVVLGIDRRHMWLVADRQDHRPACAAGRARPKR